MFAVRFCMMLAKTEDFFPLQEKKIIIQVLTVLLQNRGYRFNKKDFPMTRFEFCNFIVNLFYFAVLFYFVFLYFEKRGNVMGENENKGQF